MKFALIGLGTWGKNYLSTISRMGTCEITHICARTKKTLSKFPAKYQKTTLYQNLFTEASLHGVIIATPASTHFSIARDFIKRGIPVLIEKPVVVSVDEAAQLKQVTLKSKSLVMAGYQYLYNSAFQAMIPFYSKIGRIRYARSEGCDYGPFRSDVSALWDWLSHDISMYLRLFLKDPYEVLAWGIPSFHKTNKKRFDMIFVRYLFPTKIPVFVTIGSLSPIKKRTLMVVGLKASVVFDDTMRDKVHFIKHPTFHWDMPYNLIARSGTKKVHVSSSSPLELEVAEFIERIKSNDKKSDIATITRVTNIINATERSLLSGRAVLL